MVSVAQVRSAEQRIMTKLFPASVGGTAVRWAAAEKCRVVPRGRSFKRTHRKVGSGALTRAFAM